VSILKVFLFNIFIISSSGKLFRSKHLNLIIHELLAFREEKTYHWLLDHVIMAKFCTQFLFWVRLSDKVVDLLNLMPI
jgi:hypothetical protein